jgi:hypothetical protein
MRKQATYSCPVHLRSMDFPNLVTWSLCHWPLGHLFTWSLSHLVIDLFGRAHYNHANHADHLVRGHLVTYSLREFSI